MLPEYIPMIRHGGKRNGRLSSAMAGLSFSDFCRQKRAYSFVAEDSEGLHRYFRIDSAVPLLASFVGFDEHLEAFWSLRNVRQMVKMLKALGFVAVTMPNYSDFSDAPYFHTVWNWRRMIRVIEECASEGITVIPHLNGRLDQGFQRWVDLLKVNPRGIHICKEWQTGNARPGKARDALDDLRRLRDTVQHELHPVFMGAGFLLPYIKHVFPRYTLMDSMPFLKTMKRRVFVGLDKRGRPKWSGRGHRRPTRSTCISLSTWGGTRNGSMEPRQRCSISRVRWRCSRLVFS